MIVLNILISFAALACLVAIIKPFWLIKSRGQAFGLFLGLCFLNVMVSLGGNSSNQLQQHQTTQTTEAKPTSPIDSTTKTAGSNWDYTSSKDEMTGVERKVACTTSTNTLQFSFPYSGGSTGELCFRKKGKELSVWLQISSGQFSCGIDDCVLHFKFDQGKIESYSGVESSAHKTGLLFLEPESRLLSEVKKSQLLKVETEYYDHGREVLQFDVHGLDVSKLN